MKCKTLKLASPPLPTGGFLLALGVVLLLGGCNSQQPSNEQLQQQAQRATENAKQQSKEALKDTRIAAQNAEEKVNAIAAGVRQGMKSNAPAANGRVDLNSASEGQLASLPGISEAKARQIIRHRPYSTAHELVDRGLLTQDQFDAIAPDVKAE
jgi:DNA uptake protein ComE-like DNA-binding protein